MNLSGKYIYQNWFYPLPSYPKGPKVFPSSYDHSVANGSVFYATLLKSCDLDNSGREPSKIILRSHFDLPRHAAMLLHLGCLVILLILSCFTFEFDALNPAQI